MDGQLWAVLFDEMRKSKDGWSRDPDKQRDALQRLHRRVDSAAAPISAATAARLKSLWAVALHGVKEPSHPPGRSGTNYFFLHRLRKYDFPAYAAGNTQSRGEGTRCRALVRVAEHLAAFAQLPDSKRAEAEKALVAEADAVAMLFAASNVAPTK